MCGSFPAQNTIHQNQSSDVCKFLKIRFNKCETKIASLRSLSNLFLKSSITTPLNACTRSRRQGGWVGGASKHPKLTYNSERKQKSIFSDAAWVRCATKRCSILIIFCRVSRSSCLLDKIFSPEKLSPR